MLLLLDALTPLLKRRDTYYLAAIAVLGLLLWRAKVTVKADEAALAARPKVETRIDTQTKTVTVQGPERIVERVVQGQVVERVIERAPATTTTQADKEYDRTVAPACAPAAAAPWRYAGVVADPFTQTKLVGLRGGITLWNRFDIGLGARFAPRPEGQLEASVRF